MAPEAWAGLGTLAGLVLAAGGKVLVDLVRAGADAGKAAERATQLPAAPTPSPAPAPVVQAQPQPSHPTIVACSHATEVATLRTEHDALKADFDRERQAAEEARKEAQRRGERTSVLLARIADKLGIPQSTGGARDSL